MERIELNGTSLCVERHGSGPTALVMHGGLGIDHQAYRGLDPLGRYLRLVYYDHRGNGRSPAPLESMTMRQWADDAAALAGRVSHDAPVIVIGHSYGGFIAQEMAIRHPDRVRALVLLTTTPGQLGDGEHPAPEGPPMPEEFASLLADAPASDSELAAVMRALAPAYLHQAPPDLLLTAMEPVLFRSAAMVRGFEELAVWSSVDRLASVAVPVLLVAGRHDAFTAWPQSVRIAARLADAEVVVFEDSAHFPWLDEPDEFFETVVGWLSRRRLVG